MPINTCTAAYIGELLEKLDWCAKNSYEILRVCKIPKDGAPFFEYMIIYVE